MNEKIFYFGNDGREELLEGASYLFNAVKTTMGPGGRNVLIERPVGEPIITKDGVTVAKEVKVSSKLKNMAIDILKQATSKTADMAGDGTTTTTVLAYHIFKNGYKVLKEKKHHNIVKIKRGIDKGLSIALDYLKDYQKEPDNSDIKNIALISSNCDEDITNIVLEAIDLGGPDGFVQLDLAKDGKDKVINTKGYKFRNGFINPYFINKPEEKIVRFISENNDASNQPLIIIFRMKITLTNELLKMVLDYCSLKNKELLIICDDITEEALETLISLKVQNNLQICVTKTPGFSMTREEYCFDLSTVLNCPLITEFNIKNHIDNFKTDPNSVFGKCDEIIIDKYNTLLIGGNKKEEYINNLRSQLTKIDNDYEKTRIKERLALLTSGLVKLEIGGSSEAEANERKDRAEDCYFAVKSALEEGIVPGGGFTLYAIGNKILKEYPYDKKDIDKDELLGINIFAYALLGPLYQILQNSGYDNKEQIDKKLESTIKDNMKNRTINALTGELVNCFEHGIVDPFKVERVSLENAASVSSILLTTECSMIIENK